MPPTRDGLKAMKRSQLQRLAKQNRLRGNLKTAELVDLLAQHYEQQQSVDMQCSDLGEPGREALTRPTLPYSRKSSERTAGSSAPSPSPSSHLQDAENREPTPVVVQPVPAPANPMDKLSLQAIGLADIDLTQLSQPNLPISSRLTALETICTQRWQTELQHLARQVGEPEDKLLFEPPTLPRASSRSRRSTSREIPGPTFTWAQGQQAIANGGMGLPSVRLFGATSSSATIPEEMEVDVEAPGTSTSSSRPQLAPSALPSSVPLSTSWSSSASASFSKKSTSVDSHTNPPPESSRIARQASTSRESSRAAGKRPASPIPIPDNPHAEYDNARASKRPRHASGGGQQGESSRAAGKRNDDESPSLNSFSAGGSVSTAESPVFPPSPIVEPSTPPSKRPTALLPPIEIISTPSPTSRSQATMAMTMRKEYGDPHGFATAPRPPAEGPASPTLESPRRQMARRLKVELEPPPVLEFPSTSAVAPEIDFPTSGAYSQLELAPPPPPPHSSHPVMAPTTSARRMGSAPLLTALPRRPEKPRDYSADPDDEPSTSISTARPARMVNRAATHTTLAAPANLSTVTPPAQRTSWWRRPV
ncbi:hypothetical protein FRC01_006744 [Tulasnella sp. 417]|nr:hypothetical protein FRC01_006744 [Tulasnella sp. 417]